MSTSLVRFCVALALVVSAGCERPSGDYSKLAQDPELLHGAVDRTTDAMMEAVTSPPVAARTYAYSSVAAYEALRHAYPEYASLAGQVNGLQQGPAPEADSEYLLPLSSAYAYLTVAEALVFRPEIVAEYRDSLVQAVKDQGVPRGVVKRSVEFGDQVAKHVLAWAGTDNLKAARAAERYTVLNEDGRWQPTPPAYMAAVESNWGMLRPFTMDSAGQFRPAPPHPYDMREGSEFRRQVMEVYEIGKNLTDEQREIASFWDCNPFALQTEGHFMFGNKKISPGGHWLGITGLVLRKTGADPMRTAEGYARVSMALADGFISAWKEKYRSNLVRPETVISQVIDPTWRPLLQTPPFPEYTSGHSVISAAASEVLTDMFGDDFAFDDDVEVRFGLPVRSFRSFRHAAEEAAVSRLFGGIHYRMAAENGLVQGREVGRNLVARVKTRSSALAAKGK